MAIIDSEERASRPVVNLFEFRFNYIQNDADSVFIVVSYHSLVCVGCIGYNYSVLLWGKLCWVVILTEFINLFVFHFSVLLSLCNSHLHPPVNNNPILILLINLFLLLFLLSSILMQPCFNTVQRLGQALRFLLEFSECLRILDNPRSGLIIIWLGCHYFDLACFGCESVCWETLKSSRVFYLVNWVGWLCLA